MGLSTLSEWEFIHVIAALASLLTCAAVFGKLFEWFNAPKVVGEIFGGMLLGGSGLYYFFPEEMGKLFIAFPEEGKVLNVFYQLGLIFLMFSSGFNTKLETGKNGRRELFFLLLGATILPLLFSLPAVWLFQPHFIGAKDNHLAFLLVFMIAIAVTSIPVVSKIFFDLKIIESRFAGLVLTAATFEDVFLWVLLNIAINIGSTGSINAWNCITISLLTIGIFITVELLCKSMATRKIQLKNEALLTVTFIFLFFVVVLLSLLHINFMYSAFLAGYIVKSCLELDEKAADKFKTIADFSFSFFIPIYFALVGIQLNIFHDFSWWRFLAFFLTAFLLKGVGTGLILLLTTLRRRTIINLAVTMNARGGPGIVLATIAYAEQIINIEFFTVLILTTMLTSMLAGYWLRMQTQKDIRYFDQL